MGTSLHWAALAFYLAGTAVFLAFVLLQRRGLSTMGRAVLWAGFGLHTLALCAAWIEQGSMPAHSLRQSLDVLSWALMGAGLLVNLRLKVMILGAFTAPLCSLMLLAASVLPAPQGPPPALLASLWVVVHVGLAFTGYGLLGLNFIGGVLYLVQDAQIRGKNPGALFKRLPPLKRLDSLSHKTLMAGFCLLTLGLVIGAAYAQRTLGSYWRWDPKEVWSLITWLLYAGLLHTRLVQGWRGRRGAWLSVLAFGVLFFTFLGAGLLFPGYHSFSSLADTGGRLK